MKIRTVLAFAFAFLLLCIGMNAQVSTNVFTCGQDNDRICRVHPGSIHHLGSMDKNLLLLEDEENNSDTTRVTRFGKAFDSTFSLEDGVWSMTAQGRVWMISLEAEGALSLNLVFNHVSLPTGAEVYVTNNDRSIVFGPVTADDLNDRDKFLSDIIPGSQVNVYLFEPTEKMGCSSLEISKVVYGYNASAIMNLTSYPPFDGDVVLYPLYEFYTDGIGTLILADGTHSCSGALVMTTDNSFSPYFLTSYEGARAGKSFQERKDDIENGMFKFHVRRTLNNGALTQGYIYYGATIRANIIVTGMVLLELDDDLKNNKNLTWLGWDRSGVTPTNGAILYHQSHIEKLQIIENAFQPLNLRYWRIASGYNYYSKNYVLGATLLDNNNRLVGILNERHASDTNQLMCDFGRFDTGWQFYNSSELSLYSWLDPNGTNSMTTNARKPLTLEGPEKPCGHAVYEVPGLPEGYTVNWRLTNEPALEEQVDTANLPANRFEIIGNYVNGTVYADINRNGTIVQTLEKRVNSSWGFGGYVTGIRLANTMAPYLGLINGGTYVGNAGNSFTIHSPQLSNCTIYYSYNYRSFMYHVGNASEFTLTVPSNNQGGPIMVEIVNDEDSTYFKMFIQVNSATRMNIQHSDDICVVSLTSDSGNGETVLSAEAEDWNVKVLDTMTGITKYQSNVHGTSAQISTTGWNSGIYVVQAKVGDEVLTKKFGK